MSIVEKLEETHFYSLPLCLLIPPLTLSVCVCVFQGGRHIDYVVDQIVAKLIEVVKKKNKAGVSVKPFQVGLQVQHF